MKILPLRQIVQILPLLLAKVQTGDAKLTKRNFQKIYNKLVKSV